VLLAWGWTCIIGGGVINPKAVIAVAVFAVGCWAIHIATEEKP